MHTEFLDYGDDGLTCEAFLAYDESAAGQRPCVLVAHSWAGQSDAERETARQLALLGYVGVALDIYGKGRRGGLTEDNTGLMQPFLDDRAMLRQRLHAGLAAARKHPMVDPDRIAAIGYCFGGLCVLDLARSADAGSGLRGVVSFHGLLGAPALGQPERITAKVLILHGYDDPMAPPQSLLDFATEMSAAGADWQVHAYGGTVHAFTWPGANMPAKGILYNADADRRSWIAMKNFLEEVLA